MRKKQILRIINASFRKKKKKNYQCMRKRQICLNFVILKTSRCDGFYKR